jgi:hypothetical protein
MLQAAIDEGDFSSGTRSDKEIKILREHLISGGHIKHPLAGIIDRGLGGTDCDGVFARRQT